MNFAEMTTEDINKLNKGLEIGNHYDCYLETKSLSVAVITSCMEWFDGVEVPDHINDVIDFIRPLTREQRQKLLMEAIDCVKAFRDE